MTFTITNCHSINSDFVLNPPGRSWILSNKLIDKLQLKSVEDDKRHEGMILQGENNKWYDMDEFFRTVIDFIESKL